MQVFSFCWLVLPFRERNNFIRSIKTYNCIVFTDFQHKLYPFQNLLFQNFANFSPDILIKYILIKKNEKNTNVKKEMKISKV